MKVMIADDSIVVCSRLVEMLSDIQGVEIIGQAQDVNGAIHLYHSRKPGVVILDIRMTGGSGIDVLRAIKHEDQSVKIIMLTNYPYPQYRKKCKELGADYFFDKSNESGKVVEILKEMAVLQNQTAGR